MSIEAVARILNESPTTGNDKIILVGLANHAHPDGTGAYPAVETLERYARVDRRTVQRRLRALEAGGHIARAGLGPKGQTAWRIVFPCPGSQLELVPNEQPDDHPQSAPETAAASPEPGGGNLPPAAHRRSGAGVLKGAAPMPPEPSLEPSTTTPPTPLRGERPPKRPSSKRQREHDRYRHDLQAWIAANLDPSQPGDAETWQAARERLRTSMPAATFDVWLEPLTLAGRISGRIALSAPDEVVEWIRERFPAVLERAFDGRRIVVIPQPEQQPGAAAA